MVETRTPFFADRSRPASEWSAVALRDARKHERLLVDYIAKEEASVDASMDLLAEAANTLNYLRADVIPYWEARLAREKEEEGKADA